MKIKISDIEKITSLLLLKVKESVGDEIELKSDFYWDISADELFNPYNEPKNITLGQLSNDIEEINRLFSSEDDAIIYDLKRVASLLRAISVENPAVF